MKRFFSYIGASLVAIAALSSCNKDLTDSNEGIKGGIPFEITAESVDTKTSIDGLTTNWEAEDAINLFHAKAGSTTYTSDGEFTIAIEDLEAKKFKGTLPAALEAGNYDWYAFYPYSKYNKTPAGSSQSDFGFTTIGGTSQTQTGNNSTAHLCGKPCPLYGIATAVASDVAPSIVMNHLASIVEVNVTNNSGEDLTVTSVSFTGTEDIAGIYYINFTQTPVVYTSKDDTSVSKTALLSVTGGEAIANETSAKFYIAIKPFTVSSGALKVAVNGYEKEIPISKETVFAAGKIKKINFNFDKVVVDYVTLPWTEDFSGNLGIYSFVSTTSDTKTYDAALAGGTAPELLVAKNNGSFSAKVKASAGKYVLTFKSNHADYLSISVDNETITLNKLSDTEYTLVIPEGVDSFNITFTNTNKDNTRLDDISLEADKRTTLATPEVIAELNSDTPNSIDVAWDAVDNAGSYVVTATPATGNAVSETVNAVENKTTYQHTFSGLAYKTAYTISVVAKPSDTSLYLDSAAGEAEPVTTGANPSTGGETKTWTYALSGTTGPELNEDNPATVNGATWSITMGTKVGSPTTNGTPTKSYSNYGWKWGDNKSAYWSSYTLSTDYFASKSVKSVTVNFLNNGKKSATMTVKQGETTIGTATQTFGTTWTDLTANTTQGTGGTLTINYSVAQASYIHSITVEYYE